MKSKLLVLSSVVLSLVSIWIWMPHSGSLRTSAVTVVNAGNSPSPQPSAAPAIKPQNPDALRAALLTAVMSNRTEDASNLIAQGADVNCRISPNGWSVLHYAARNGNAEVVQLLLAAGADPDYVGTMEGQTDDVVNVNPLVLAEAALDLVSQIPRSEMEDTLRPAGLDDPDILKSMTNPKALDRYQRVVDLLSKVTKDS
jgi:ankyrin repeat protein